MNVQSYKLPLQGLGGSPSGDVVVTIQELEPRDRLKRAATFFGGGLLAALILLPIPIVHFVGVPGALVVGSGLALWQLTRRQRVDAAEGACPYCAVTQRFFIGMGAPRFPLEVSCCNCLQPLWIQAPSTPPAHT